MGNVICVFDRCGSNTNTPVTFMEYEYENTQPKQDLRKNKRMDIMGEAMHLAMFDFKFYLGHQIN